MAFRRAAGWLMAVCFVATACVACAGDRATATIEGRVVDEAGKPVAGAVVRAVGNKTASPVTSADDGTFRLPLKSNAREYVYAGLLAEKGAKRLGFLEVYQEADKLKPVELVLKPAHRLSVQVTDGRDAPASGAEVQALVSMRALASGTTDAEGHWTGLIPADAADWAVLARKPEVGFDYLVPRPRRSRDEQPTPLPGDVALKLDGAATVRVKVVDREGKPLPGVGVGPWYIHKPGREEDVNLSGASDEWPKTGDDGVAVLDWVPDKIERRLPIMVRSETHQTTENSTPLDITAGEREVTITLLPLERLSGRVTHSDGKPAEGIVVTAHGQGIGHNNGCGLARTDADGRYEMKVNSEQAYLVAVSGKQWSAPYRSDVVLRAGKPVDRIDFTLVPATRVHGRVTVGDKNEPVPESYITLVADAGEIPAELEALRPEGDRTYYSVSMHLSAYTDADGRFEFAVGPGEYELRGPVRTEPVAIAIPTKDPPGEIVQDFRMERPEAGPFTVTVVDTDGKPVVGAGVVGRYRAFTPRHGWYQAIKTDERGKLKTERSLDPVVLYASNGDETLAGVARVGAEETEATIVVGPTAKAAGQLFDKEGNVLAGKELTYGIRIPSGPDESGPFSNNFGGKVKTDDEGRFTLTGLVPGEKYELDLAITDHSWRTVTVVTATDANPIDLAELKIDPHPTPPYVPPTPAVRLAKAFDNKADMPLDERLANLLDEARREHTVPLLFLGRPEDAGGIDLYTAFYEQPEPVDDEDAAEKPKSKTPRDLRWEFELAALSLERPEVAELAADLGLPTTANGPAMLVVLAEDGSLLATHQLVVTDGKLDRSALTAFLLEHKRPTRDAERMLAEALVKANAEDKRVYLIASASWCGPCRMLARFLDPHKQELEQHYVFVKLDVSRDDHGDAVRDRYQGDRDGGVPWHAILDADGKTLATSNLPEDDSDQSGANIGYPSSPDGIAHFLSMLKDTAPRLTDESLATLRTALERED